MEPSSVGRNRSLKSVKSKKTVLFAVGGVASALVFCLAVLGKTKPTARLSMPDLPDSPLPQERGEVCRSKLSCREKGKMLATRAHELAHRAGGGAAEQVRAASLLARASRLLAAGDDPGADEVESSAKRMEREVTAAYRRQVLALRLAVERGDGAAARAISERIKEYLVAQDDRAGNQLHRLPGAEEEE